MSQEEKTVLGTQEKRECRQYSPEEINRVVCDYFRSGTTIAAYSKQVGIPAPTLSCWLVRFRKANPTITAHAMSKDERTKQLEAENAQLKRQLSEMHEQLEFERYHVHALDTMIDVAEGMFNISIRKKVGTKQ
ncbi:MAG: transposase [Fibrobacter sp.]|nr:transposase [Bacteroidaceae bacterium]MCF0224448.1 transposase [Fibrobacter sp.]